MKDPLKYAYLLLKFRLRTEKELRDRMRRKGFSDEEIEDTLEILRAQGLLDKEEFLREFIESRMLKPLSRFRISCELKKFGFSDEEIKNALDRFYNDEEVEERIRSYLIRHFEDKSSIDEKTLQKILRYFGYRGFNAGYILDIIHRLGFRTG